MSRGYVLSAPARRDLDAVLEYVFIESGPRAALSLVAEFRAAFARLSSFPHIGHRSERLPVGSCRIWNVFDYLVIYDPGTDPLEIVRIVHGARGAGAFAGDA